MADRRPIKGSADAKEALHTCMPIASRSPAVPNGRQIGACRRSFAVAVPPENGCHNRHIKDLPERKPRARKNQTGNIPTERYCYERS